MVITPEPIIKLTPEQEASLATYQLRLANLENEISIASRNLRVIKQDTEKIVKEKIYQQELYDQAKAQAEKESEKLATINSEVGTAQIELDKITELHKTTTLQIEFERKEIADRETVLSASESSLKNEQDYFNIKSSQLLEEQNAVNTAKEAFLKATETVSWK